MIGRVEPPRRSSPPFVLPEATRSPRERMANLAALAG